MTGCQPGVVGGGCGLGRAAASCVLIGKYGSGESDPEEKKRERTRPNQPGGVSRRLSLWHSPMRTPSLLLARRAAVLLAQPTASTSGRASTAGHYASWAWVAPNTAAAGGAIGQFTAGRAPGTPAAGALVLARGLLAAVRPWGGPVGHRGLHTSPPAAADGAPTPTSSPRPRPPSSSFVRLNTLAPAPGSSRPAKRVGRGIGSGRGKTSGRGHKGQKARSGATPRLGFEGGQTPLGKRLPKRGFVSPTTVTYTPVNLGRLQALVEAGRLDPGRPVTMRDLVAAGAVSKKTPHGVKLLGRGAADLKTALRVEVSAVSPSARAAVEAAGGAVTRVYFNALNLRCLLRPGWLAGLGRAPPRPAAPPPKRAGLFDAVGIVPPDEDGEGGGGGGGGGGGAAAAAEAAVAAV